jgi:hypothetical protein
MNLQPALAEQTFSPGATFGTRYEIGYPDLNALLAALEHERIATLAYTYWEQRGCPPGSPDEDWHRAEQNIRGGVN